MRQPRGGVAVRVAGPGEAQDGPARAEVPPRGVFEAGSVVRGDVDDHVYGAEYGHGLHEQALGVYLVVEISADAHGRGATGLDLAKRRFHQLLIVEVDQDDLV